jgi:hypothetical protein
MTRQMQRVSLTGHSLRKPASPSGGYREWPYA